MPDSEGKFKRSKLFEKRGKPPLLHTSEGPDNLQVRRGALLLTSSFSRATEGVNRGDTHLSQGATSWDYVVHALKKKALSQFSVSQ